MSTKAYILLFLDLLDAGIADHGNLIVAVLDDVRLNVRGFLKFLRERKFDFKLEIMSQKPLMIFNANSEDKNLRFFYLFDLVEL